jgi:hypothetical protein
MDILSKIIEEEGHCGLWATPAVCRACPLSRLKQKEDGSYLSCVESLGATELSEAEADALYKEVAVRLLLEKTIDDLLVENNDAAEPN